MSIPFFSKLRSQKHYLQLVKPELKQVSEFVEAQSSCFDPEVADYMETVCQSKGKMLRPALVLLVAGATGGIKEAHIRLSQNRSGHGIPTHDDTADARLLCDFRRQRIPYARNNQNLSGF